MSAATKPSWRDFYKVHPACEVFPPLSPDELQKLADDIHVNGLNVAIETRHVAGPDGGTTYVIDGRNRLAALEDVLGYQIVNDKGEWIGSAKARHLPGYTNEKVAADVLSLNLRRRHQSLTKEQQVELIDAVLRAASGNDFANMARSFSPVAGEKGGSTKDGHKAAVVTEAAKVGVSKRTVERTLAKAKADERAPQPTESQKPKPKRKPQLDVTELLDKQLNGIIDEVRHIPAPNSEFAKIVALFGKLLTKESERLRGGKSPTCHSLGSTGDLTTTHL
jgi:hypothetical protein